VLIADTGNHLVRVLEFQTPDYVTTTIAGQVAAMGVVNMPGADARFFKPFGICMGLGGTGTVLVADPPAQVVRFLSFDGTTVGTLCGTVGTPGTANGLTGQLNNPSGVTVLGSRVYIADTNNHAIRSYDSSLGLQTLAGTIGTPGASDGQFPTGKFRSPKGVYATGASTILVADSGNHTIRMLDTSSIVTTISGVAGSPGSADGGPSVARFNNPTGIVSDAAGRIFVADTDNHTIRMLFMTNFYTASTVAGQAGSPGFVDGTATQARFNHPTSLAISGNTLYVTDSDNDTIRAIDLTSFAVTTVAGQPGIQGSRDGFGPEALFQKPLGVAVDGGGFIYVTDSLNANIRKGHQTLSDFGAIDQDVAPVGDERQLNVFSETPESSYLWRIVRRPAGSTAELSSNTGDVVQFTPDVPDLYIFEMRAFGSGTELSISVIEFFASPLPPVIDSPLTADGVVGQLFSYAITATNNPVIFGISTLPPGLLFDPNTGVLYGTPTTSGVYNIDISAVNGGGSDTQTLVLTVKTPPALTLSSLDNPGLINTPVSFMFDVAATDPVTFQYLIDYGDGSMQDSGTITPGTPITTQHTYTQAGDFTVTVFLKDIEALVTSQSVVQTVFGPSSGGDGVKSASDDGKTILNPINGITIQVMNSNGGVIQLGIDVDALDRSAYDASTFFGDIAGRASTVIGPRPVHQFLNRGIFVAKTSGIHRVTHVVGGIARKTLVVGAKETGATVPTTRNARDARVVGDAPSSVISTKTLKGKFIFSGNKNDVVSYTGMIQLPAGLAVSAPHEFSIGIGNIVVDTMVDKKGKGEVPGNPAILKKLKLTYLKVKKGTITQGGEIARVDVTFNTAGMIDAGFDTEGIIRSATDAAGGKKAPRQIQIAMLLDGVPYTVLAPVTFTVSSTTAFGSISGRSGL
jgi:sugar lactone lactonase YvrE